MPKDGAGEPRIFSISANHSFADGLAAELIRRFAADPLRLVGGRILLPNNRAVRAVTDAFVRNIGNGLLLPRLIPIGDPELEERIGGALEDAEDSDPVAPPIDPAERLLTFAAILARGGTHSAEALRLAQDLARALDALRIEDISPARLAEVIDSADDLAGHWQKSLAKLELIVRNWPTILAERGRIDLTERRNLLLRRTARRWKAKSPPGFTIAAGITTAAPAVAELLSVVARMPGGEVVVPGLWLEDVLPGPEWDALAPGDGARGEPNHPQYQLRLLLDRMNVNRALVRPWPVTSGPASPATRALAIANAMAAPAFSDKWASLPPAARRLQGVRLAQFADSAAEAQGIALALRQALETPGKTAALITPDRNLAGRVSALLRRWEIEADDSAGEALARSPAASLILAIAAAAAEELAPVALLALLKHPLVGGEAEERRRWLDQVRDLDLGLRGPRPAAGLAGLDRHFAKDMGEKAWQFLRPAVASLDGLFAGPQSLAGFAAALAAAAETLAAARAWSRQDGRMVAGLLAQWQTLAPAAELNVTAADAVPLIRQLFDGHSLRPPFGKHPRIFIWGLLEARLQRADLVVLGGLNEGTWPALSAPDPWLPPKVRSKLGMPTLETRIGLAAQDFAGALGAPEVLVTRARREGRSPTVASRLWLRLRAMDPDIAIDPQLPVLAMALDDPGAVRPAGKPAPKPAAALRPKRIAVTDVDRLKADPFAFYAKAVLRLRALDPVDIDPTAAWKGTAVHEVLDRWFKEDRCESGALAARIATMLRDPALHPLVRALWQPRLARAIQWVADQVESDFDAGRAPVASEIEGSIEIDEVTLRGKADRIDRDRAGNLAIVDYKTGKAPSRKAVETGFALQLGLLGLIAERGGFEGISGRTEAFEYWSFADGGKRVDANKKIDDFLTHCADLFGDAASRWLTGDEGFVAKLNPAYAPYGDYDQLMRLEEWYGRE